MTGQGRDSGNYCKAKTGEIPKPIDHSPEKYLDDLYRVGPDKPLGYLAIGQLRDSCMVDITSITNYLESRGLKTAILGKSEKIRVSNRNGMISSIVKSTDPPRLFCYDPKSLQKLLDDNQDILNESKWPVDSDLFIEMVHNVSADHGKLFDLIADAFADYDNPFRRIP